METESPSTFVRFLWAGLARAPKHLWGTTKAVEEVVGVGLFVVAVVAFLGGLVGWLMESAPRWLEQAGWAGVVVLLIALLRGLYDVYVEERDQRSREADEARGASARRSASFRRANEAEADLERVRQDRDGYRRNWDELHEPAVERLQERVRELEHALEAKLAQETHLEREERERKQREDRKQRTMLLTQQGELLRSKSAGERIAAELESCSPLDHRHTVSFAPREPAMEARGVLETWRDRIVWILAQSPYRAMLMPSARGRRVAGKWGDPVPRDLSGMRAYVKLKNELIDRIVAQVREDADALKEA